LEIFQKLNDNLNYLHFPENSIFKVNWGFPIFFLYEFKLLPEQEQYRKLFNKKGEFITYRLGPNARFALYALDKFFVEVEYNPKKNKIVKNISFLDGQKLEMYSKFKL